MDEQWSVRHRILHRVVYGAPGISTAELNLLYNALAPVLYRGTLETPVAARRTPSGSRSW